MPSWATQRIVGTIAAITGDQDYPDSVTFTIDPETFEPFPQPFPHVGQQIIIEYIALEDE
jgi:hypothetical protein